MEKENYMKKSVYRFITPLVLLSAMFTSILVGCDDNPSEELIDSCMVIYSKNGADGGAVPSGITCYPGDTVTVSRNTGSLTKNGYSFTGWNTLANGEGESYQSGDCLVMPESNVWLYAQWTADPVYSVTYHAEDAESGSVPVDSGNYLEGETVTVSGNTGGLVRSGWSFIGWNTKESGLGTGYTCGSQFIIEKTDVDLYAAWTSDPVYTVTYHAADAESGSVPVDSNYYLENAKVTVIGNTGDLVLSGMNFKSWNILSDGTGANYTAGIQFSMGSENVDLYAQWSLPSGSIVINNPEYPSFSMDPSSFVLQIDGGTTEQTIAVSADEGISISSYNWLINGISRGTGSSISLDTEADPDWFERGQNTLTLIVVIDEMPYSDSFIFKVEQY